MVPARLHVTRTPWWYTRIISMCLAVLERKDPWIAPFTPLILVCSFATTQRNAIQHSKTQRNTTQCNTTQRNATQHNTVQHTASTTLTTAPHSAKDMEEGERKRYRTNRPLGTYRSSL